MPLLPPRRRMEPHEISSITYRIQHAVTVHDFDPSKAMEIVEWMSSREELVQRLDITTGFKNVLKRDGNKWQATLNATVSVIVLLFREYPRWHGVTMHGTLPIQWLGEDEINAISNAVTLAAADEGWPDITIHCTEGHEKDDLSDSLAALDEDLLAEQLNQGLDSWLRDLN